MMWISNSYIVSMKPVKKLCIEYLFPGRHNNCPMCSYFYTLQIFGITKSSVFKLGFLHFFNSLFCMGANTPNIKKKYTNNLKMAIFCFNSQINYFAECECKVIYLSFSFPVQMGLHMCHLMRKPVYAICEQQRCRSACTDDQCLYCSLPV